MNIIVIYSLKGKVYRYESRRYSPAKAIHDLKMLYPRAHIFSAQFPEQELKAR